MSSASFLRGKRVVLVGSTGGLGLEVARGLKAAGAEVYGTVRGSNKPEEVEDLRLADIITGIDMEDEKVGHKIAEGLPEGKVDVLLIIAGYFTTETFEELNFGEERKMMEICAFGPLRVVQQLYKAGVLQSQVSKVAMVTSEGGSIGLRTEKEGGGNYGHHISKCAQNMMGRLLSLDLKPKGIPVVMLHPGFLRTTMTSHYADLYDEYGAIEPHEAVGPLLEAIDRLSIDTTGRFVAPLGSKGLGLGVHALPGSHLDPQGELPW